MATNPLTPHPTEDGRFKPAFHRLGVLLGQQPEALLAELSTVAPIPAAPPQMPVGLASELLRRSLEDAVKSSQESLRLANQLYANGLANFINVLDAERSLYQAQDQLVQSEDAVSTDLISLYKALGGGWETASKLADAR